MLVVSAVRSTFRRVAAFYVRQSIGPLVVGVHVPARLGSATWASRSRHAIFCGSCLMLTPRPAAGRFRRPGLQRDRTSCVAGPGQPACHNRRQTAPRSRSARQSQEPICSGFGLVLLHAARVGPGLLGDDPPAAHHPGGSSALRQRHPPHPAETGAGLKRELKSRVPHFLGVPNLDFPGTPVTLK